MHAGKEAIALMSIGFAFMLLSVVFFLTRKNADLGLDFLDAAVEMTDSATDQVISETFDEITYDKKTIPASGAYSLIAYNENAVESIVCHICDPGKTGNVAYSLEESCLIEHISGDIIVWAKKDDRDNQYTVYLASKLSTLVDPNNNMNELAHGEEMMDPTTARNILIQNKYHIDKVYCTICGKSYSELTESCLYKREHAKIKTVVISAIFDSGQYSITIKPVNP